LGYTPQQVWVEAPVSADCQDDVSAAAGCHTYEFGLPVKWYVSALKSSRKDLICELNAHEHHHNVVNAIGKLWIFFKI